MSRRNNKEVSKDKHFSLCSRRVLTMYFLNWHATLCYKRAPADTPTNISHFTGEVDDNGRKKWKNCISTCFDIWHKDARDNYWNEKN